MSNEMLTKKVASAVVGAIEEYRTEIVKNACDGIVAYVSEAFDNYKLDDKTIADIMCQSIIGSLTAHDATISDVGDILIDDDHFNEELMRDIFTDAIANVCAEKQIKLK